MSSRRPASAGGRRTTLIATRRTRTWSSARSDDAERRRCRARSGFSNSSSRVPGASCVVQQTPRRAPVGWRRESGTVRGPGERSQGHRPLHPAASATPESGAIGKPADPLEAYCKRRFSAQIHRDAPSTLRLVVDEACRDTLSARGPRRAAFGFRLRHRPRRRTRGCRRRRRRTPRAVPRRGRSPAAPPRAESRRRSARRGRSPCWRGLRPAAPRRARCSPCHRSASPMPGPHDRGVRRPPGGRACRCALAGIACEGIQAPGGRRDRRRRGCAPPAARATTSPPVFPAPEVLQLDDAAAEIDAEPGLETVAVGASTTMARNSPSARSSLASDAAAAARAAASTAWPLASTPVSADAGAASRAACRRWSAARRSGERRKARARRSCGAFPHVLPPRRPGHACR